MTIIERKKSGFGARYLWPSLAAVVVMVGGGCLWLSAAHQASTDGNQPENRYSPLTKNNGANKAASKAVPDSKNAASHSASHPLDEALKFVQPSLAALKDVKNYTAVFAKTELVHGRLLTQTMDMKFRQQPFSVYFHSHSKRKAGREVIFVDGQNDGKLIVHEVGLKAIVGTLNLNPEDPKVMDTSRHPITEVGMAKIIESAIDIWKNEKQNLDPATIDVQIVQSVQVGETECEAVEIGHRRQAPGLDYQIGRVYVDKQSRLPVQAELYGWPQTADDEPPLLEKYTYTQVKTNVSLSDSDFDPQNREYRFAVTQRD